MNLVPAELTQIGRVCAIAGPYVTVEDVRIPPAVGMIAVAKDRAGSEVLGQCEITTVRAIDNERYHLRVSPAPCFGFASLSPSLHTLHVCVLTAEDPGSWSRRQAMALERIAVALEKMA